MLNEFCKVVDFHFNKGHLADPQIPMWVIKTKGQTFYVNHLEASAPWSTRETPDHSSTKGSLRFRNVYLTIDGEGDASITSQEMVDAVA